MDAKQVAQKVIALSGGCENLTSITHCSTRLRFFVRNKARVKTEEIKAISGVLGVVFVTDELQIVFGKNVIPVYTEAVNIYEATGGKTGDTVSDDESPVDTPKLTGKARIMDLGNRLIGFVSGSVTPLIPGLVSGGMLKVFLLLATLVYPAFGEMSTYTLLSQLANVPFYFMPVFVAYGVAKKLGGTPLYAMSVAAALVYPDFISMLKEGPVTILSLLVTKVTYSSTLLPALLIGIFAYYCEKFLSKLIPGILRTVLVGMCTMGLTYVAGITILGPLGDLAGGIIVHFFLWSSATFGPVAIALLAAAMPWLVMTGMHHAVTPFMVQAFADPGYDVFFRPSYILHNMAEGGACLGVAFRTKNKAFRAECLSLAFGCIVAGVTEPALYGVNLRLKKPMIGIMAGAATGGVIAGALGATAYVYGYSTILALPIFQDTIVSMAIAVVAAIVVAAIVTFILGFEDDAPATAENDTSANDTDDSIVAVADGSMIPMENVNDETFASKMLGDGVAFTLAGNTIVAPRTGTLSLLAETGHAFGISCKDGVELLVHVGINTVEMNGVGFTNLVQAGADVKAGDPIIRVDLEMLKQKGYDMTTMLIIIDSNGKEIRFRDYSPVRSGEIISL
ncbi:MAG: glucose PTS transporter subunit IIA [Clostridiales bacterium]|nr:glucose PTS transporter subunit IIA [Clostridiales bacterium]